MNTKNTFSDSLLVLPVFLISFAVGESLGLGFDMHLMKFGWQFADTEWLMKDAAHTLWNMHGQPPLFNLILALALKISPLFPGLVLKPLFLCFGFLFLFTFYETLKLLKVGFFIRFPLLLILAFHPDFLLYERWLFYTMPCAALLSCSFLFLLIFLKKKKYRFSFIFFSILTVLALSRSLFHYTWILLVLTLIVLFSEKEVSRKKVLYSALPLLLLFFWQSKNMTQFGFFGTSSWSGMSLAKVVFYGKNKYPSPKGIAKIHPFAPLYLYKPFLNKEKLPKPEEDTPDILFYAFKRDSVPNFHHPDYLTVSRMYRTEAFKAISEKPGVYTENVMYAAGLFFNSPTNYSFFSHQLPKLAAWTSLSRRYIDWVVITPKSVGNLEGGVFSLSFRALLLYLSMGAFSFRLFLRKAFLGKALKPDEAFLCIAGMTCMFVWTVSSFFEWGENMRFRFLALGLEWVWLGYCIKAIYKSLHKLFYMKKESL